MILNLYRRTKSLAECEGGGAEARQKIGTREPPVFFDGVDHVARCPRFAWECKSRRANDGQEPGTCLRRHKFSQGLERPCGVRFSRLDYKRRFRRMRGLFR